MGFPITNHPFWGLGIPHLWKKNTSSHEALRWHVPCCRFSVGTSTCAAGCPGETRSGKGLVMVKNRMRKVKTTILLVDESPKKKLLAHFWCGFFIPSFVLCSFCALKTNFLQFCSLCWARQTRDFWWLKTLFFLPNLVLRMATLGVIPKPFCWFMSHYISIRSLVLHPDCPSINYTHFLRKKIFCPKMVITVVTGYYWNIIGIPISQSSGWTIKRH